MAVEPLTADHVMNFVLQRRRLIVVMVLLGLSVGMAHYLLSTRRYEARLVVLPSLHGDSAMLGMAGDLAQLAGINLGGKTDLTLLYREILTSDLVLDRMLDVVPNDDGKLGGLSQAQVLTAEAREKAVRQLRRMISVTRDSRSRAVEVRVQSRTREGARAIADSLGMALDRYLGAARRSDSNAHHAFLSNESAGVSAALDALESRLADFQSRNRLIDQSPALRRDETLLRREIMIKEAVLIELEKQVELSALGMRRDVPVISFLEPARAYSRPVYPRLLQSLLMGLGASIISLIGIAVGRQLAGFSRAATRRDP